MSKLKLLLLCNSQTVTTYCLALQKLSVLSKAAHRLFLRRFDQQILQNILPVQLNQHLIGLIRFSSVCPPALYIPKTDRTAGYKDCNLQITLWSVLAFYFLLIELKRPELNHNACCSVFMWHVIFLKKEMLHTTPTVPSYSNLCLSDRLLLSPSIPQRWHTTGWWWWPRPSGTCAGKRWTFQDGGTLATVSPILPPRGTRASTWNELSNRWERKRSRWRRSYLCLEVKFQYEFRKNLKYSVLFAFYTFTEKSWFW